jgi:hypothetical protein
MGGPDIQAEVAWIRLVAHAFESSPIVGRTREALLLDSG